MVLDWLGDARPDVLCVQETKVQDEEFPSEAFRETGYKVVFRGQKGYNGVAIFSTAEMSEVSFGLDTEPADEPRLARAKVREVTIVNSYVPQGYERMSDKFEYKLRWFGRLREYFERNFEPADKIVWVGDFNVAPEAIDVYDPKGLEGHVCFCPEVREALYGVKKWGFVDIFREFCKDGGQYTFWDYRLRGSLSKNRGWRLDHIMVTEPLLKTAKRCFIDKGPRLAERPSDHTPVVADFEI